MDKIKPYMFWVICGAILVVELVCAVVLEPQNSDSKTAQQAAQSLNRSVSALRSSYGDKAGNTPPDTFVIDDVAYFETLREEYLLTDKWRSGLEKVKADLDAHKTHVEKDLQDGSKKLHTMIEGSSLAEWYFAYEKITAAHLKKMREAQLLVIANDPFAKIPEGKSEADIYKANSRLRTLLGFFTKGSNFPTQEEQLIITLRLRMSEAIMEAVASSEARLLANNLVNTADEAFILPPDAAVKAQLMAINWGGSASEWDAIESFPIKGGRVLPLTVTLRGSAAALLAACARIEEHKSPVCVVHGSDWKKIARRFSRKEAVGKKVDEDVELTLSIAILDYQGAK